MMGTDGSRNPMVSLGASVTRGASGSVSVGTVSKHAERDSREMSTRRLPAIDLALFG